MSFSSQIKDHLIKEDIKAVCCSKAELLCLCMQCKDGIYKTQDVVYRNRLFFLCKKACIEEPNETVKVCKEKTLYSINIGKIYEILLENCEKILENECCKRSFLKTAFICFGTVNSPQSRYARIEFVCEDEKLKNIIYNLVKGFGISLNTSIRNGKSVIYSTKKENVADMLTIIGANKERLIFDNAAVEKEVNNNVNRIMNCDRYNLNVIVEVSAKQTEAIKLIIKHNLFDTLSDDIKYTAELRLQNPELNMTDLAQIHKPALSRSGLSHRMSKILKMAEKLK